MKWKYLKKIYIYLGLKKKLNKKLRRLISNIIERKKELKQILFMTTRIKEWIKRNK